VLCPKSSLTLLKAFPAGMLFTRTIGMLGFLGQDTTRYQMLTGLHLAEGLLPCRSASAVAQG
jgi:hypothetical protein